MATFAALRDSLDEFLTAHLKGLENDQRIEALARYCQGLGFEVEAKAALGLAAAWIRKGRVSLPTFSPGP